jgi:bloom syndrome protein
LALFSSELLGGGKSLCYQLPAILSQGITVVVSPLLSLIQDQVTALQNMNIFAMSFSSNQAEVSPVSELRAISPSLKLLYVTPEKLARSAYLMDRLRELNGRGMLHAFVIDEAHCISHWGHDFRKDYTELKMLKKEFPRVPLMALTATATNKVKLDIAYQLNLKECEIFQQSFNRTNLHYSVTKKTKNSISEIASFISTTYPHQSGIIYCLSRKECESVSDKLQQEGLKITYYHAELDAEERRRRQEDWQLNRIDVIVATVAFGMGINKPDVRFVIHHTLPKSLDGYCQEAGRAGRDGNSAHCVLYYTYNDKSKIENMIMNDRNDTEKQSPWEQKMENIRKLNQMVGYCENRVDCRRVLQLMYFDEVFDKRQCGETCDNCASRQVFEHRDVTEDAKSVVRLVNDFQQNFTLIQAVKLWRGDQVKGFTSPHAQGSKYSRDDGERLFRMLVIKVFLFFSLLFTIFSSLLPPLFLFFFFFFHSLDFLSYSIFFLFFSFLICLAFKRNF